MTTHTSKKVKLINCTLTSLIGKNVTGIVAQVRNPKYIDPQNDVFPLYRTMKVLKTFKERGKQWVELHWESAGNDTCSFTGCTVESDSCMIQISPEELTKLNRQSNPAIKH